MAEKRAKHAFGNSQDLQKALDSGKIDAYDILFLDGDTEPKIGWIDAKGEIRLVQNEADFSELETLIAAKADAADVEALEEKIANKVTAEEVDAKIANKVDAVEVDAKIESSVATANAYTNKMIEAAMDEHLTKKYEIMDVPVGTLVNYREDEIRIMVPNTAVWNKQNVGDGGDANCYYMTLRTYAPEGAVGYREHLGSQVDEEILVDLKTDEYGRKYQPTWLALAKYDAASDTWTYYGSTSTVNHYIGWDYRIDFYDAENVMIASNGIRINLSNENCHATVEPYYVSEIKTDVEAMIDKKIEEVNSSYEIVEF